MTDDALAVLDVAQHALGALKKRLERLGDQRPKHEQRARERGARR